LDFFERTKIILYLYDLDEDERDTERVRQGEREIKRMKEKEI
jgi:hypothetical protein